MTSDPLSRDRKLVQIVFELPRHSSGWPPVTTEGVWAEPRDDGLYRITSTPWFVRGVARDDIVRASPTGELASAVYDETMRWSGNLTLRVKPDPNGPFEGNLDAILSMFRTMAVYGEAVTHHGIVALTVPTYAPMEHVKHLVHRGQADGWWTFEEGCVDERWLRIEVVVPTTDATPD